MLLEKLKTVLYSMEKKKQKQKHNKKKTLNSLELEN